MLTGRVPFTDDNPMNVLQMHLRQPVPPLPPNVPPAVQHLIMRCLDKEPGRRFQSATELMQACEQVMGGGGQMPQQHNMGPPPPQMGPPPPQMGPPPMAPPAGAAQKTMIADIGGGPPPAGGFGPPPAALKTMIADGPALMAQVRANMPPPGPPSIPPGNMSLPPGPPPGMGGGSPKTMILDNSEGIVSIAAGGGAAAAVPQPMMDPESTSVTDAGGAGVLFWIFCLLAGLGLGVLAYVILLQVS